MEAGRNAKNGRIPRVAASWIVGPLCSGPAMLGVMEQSGHVRLWRYRVPPEHRGEFVRHYRAEGTWVQLFRRASGYLGTQLWVDQGDPGIYFTADHWETKAAFDAFGEEFRAEYERLDAEYEGLTSAEEFLGAGDAV